ncbi:hypothetical protein HMPREF1339_00562 [Enterococcus faecalis ERV72]|nr:hypothetical protein HMPREF1339_00562 [Enterococcus faecalis ERV72]
MPLIFGEFRLISEGAGSVPAVYQILSVKQKSKVIFVPRSFLLGPRTDFLSLIFQKDYKRVMIVLRVRKKGDK